MAKIKLVKTKQTAQRKLFCGTFNVELLQALLANLALYYPEVCVYAEDSLSAVPEPELEYVRLWVVTRNPLPTELDLRVLAAAQAYTWGFIDRAHVV